MRNLDPRQARWIRVRMVVLGCLLASFAGAVTKRAWKLQVQDGEALSAMAQKQYARVIRPAPKRGTIYDRNGAELAVSVDTESVWANPKVLKDKGQNLYLVASMLSEVLGVDQRVIFDRLSSEKYFVWLRRQVLAEQAEEVRKLALPGVSIIKEARRYYPNRELGAHVLGMANVDGEGIEGLELTYNEALKGGGRDVLSILDRRGVIVYSERTLDERADRGSDLVLTIDKTLQYLVERELVRAVTEYKAKAGNIIVLEPNTGELLAIASYPTFNPNDPSSAPIPNRRNRAVTDRFEPGSTLKPFTVAGALDAGVLRADQWIDCEHGAMRIDKYTIHDTMHWGALLPRQVLAKSSNIGAAKIGAMLGKTRLYDVLSRFGFGEKTDIGLPGEIRATLRPIRKWYEMDVATISFGQGISVTSIQMAMAMAAVANGGRLLTPKLVRQERDPYGEVVNGADPKPARYAVRPEIAKRVADMLVSVTEDEGTGVEAAISGYSVAGKTGTAQKADYVHGGYAKDQWVASFVGFAPAEKARVVISVVIDEPTVEHYGGMVAGAVFRRVGLATLRHLGVPPTRPERMLAHTSVASRHRTTHGPMAGQRVRREESGL